MQETWVQSLGQEDPLEKGMVTHPSILAWRIPRTEEPGGLQSMGLQRVRHNWATNTFTFTLPLASEGHKNYPQFADLTKTGARPALRVLTSKQAALARWFLQFLSRQTLRGGVKVNVLVAQCWGPEWGTPPVAKVMKKEARHTQRWDQASGVPLEILEHLPP